MITESMMMRALNAIFLALRRNEQWSATGDLLRSPSGTEQWLTVFAVAALIVSVMLLFWVLAKRERAEKQAGLTNMELQKANRELKQMQSQLVQTEKLAAIGQLAAGVAHEMNTPVAFVASNFETLDSYIEKIKGLLEAYDQLTA